jgi:hypothetical protein
MSELGNAAAGCRLRYAGHGSLITVRACRPDEL